MTAVAVLVVQVIVLFFGANKMRLALVQNGRVKTIILGRLKNHDGFIDVDNIRCGIGWLANEDGTFTDDFVQPVPVTGGVDEVKELLRQANTILNSL